MAGAAIIELHEGARRLRAVAPLALELLARPRPRVRVDGGPPREISLRHAEILCLLAAHPNGLTAAQLTFHLYGDAGNCVSTRVEMTRLRRMLGEHLDARPYRLRGRVDVDIAQLERDAAEGAFARALRSYPGELLPESEVPRVRQARDELHGAIQRAALMAELYELWTWIGSEPGREDVDALRAFLRRSEASDPRRAVVLARLRVLERTLALPAL